MSSEDVQAHLRGKMPKDIYEAHDHSTENRAEIEASRKCGCFYCLQIFTPDKVREWITSVDTEFAMCPYCGIDSVLGDASGYPITKKFLKKMNKYWFGGDGAAISKLASKDVDTITLANAYIKYWQKPKHHDDEPEAEVLVELDEMVHEDPLNALRTMYRISEKTSDENILGVLGAGPLQDLLGSDAGGRYLNEVIERARQDKNWRIAYGCVWTSSFRDREVAQRIEASLDVFFPDGRL